MRGSGLVGEDKRQMGTSLATKIDRQSTEKANHEGKWVSWRRQKADGNFTSNK